MTRRRNICCRTNNMLYHHPVLFSFPLAFLLDEHAPLCKGSGSAHLNITEDTNILSIRANRTITIAAKKQQQLATTDMANSQGMEYDCSQQVCRVIVIRYTTLSVLLFLSLTISIIYHLTSSVLRFYMSIESCQKTIYSVQYLECSRPGKRRNR